MGGEKRSFRCGRFRLFLSCNFASGGEIMAEFDPYRIWLGIPPHEQPPNYYRLLGLTLFESDRDAIANAADRQMAHLRTFQGGKNSAVSQKILNEVAAARICLLDPKKREQYNAVLRGNVSSTVPMDRGRENSPSQPVENLPVEDSSALEAPPIIKFPTVRAVLPVVSYHSSHRRKKNRWRGRMVTLIVFSVGLVFVLSLFLIAKKHKGLEPTVEKKTSRNSPPLDASQIPVLPKPVPPEAIKPPVDSAAENEKTGKRMCFMKNNWREGLPKLAASADEELKNLARKELSDPESKADRLAVADDWWAIAEKYAPPANEQIRQHAVEWYQKVLGELEDSERDRAEWRINQEMPTPRGEKRPVNPEKLE
jgi:hypothetical protein